MATRPDDANGDLDAEGQAEIEGRAGSDERAGRGAPEPPPAGPHDAPGLTEPEATPGAGALPDPTPNPTPDGEADAATC